MKTINLTMNGRTLKITADHVTNGEIREAYYMQMLAKIYSSVAEGTYSAVWFSPIGTPVVIDALEEVVGLFSEVEGLNVSYSVFSEELNFNGEMTKNARVKICFNWEEN